MPNAHSVTKTNVTKANVLPMRVVKILARRCTLLFALVLGLVSLLSGPAAASDRVVWKQTKLKEDDKSWKVSLEVYLDRAPDVAMMPVRFSFTPITYFERALIDGRKDPVTRQLPLQNQQPIVESVDVGFLDPGTGKAAKRTRYSFRVTRDRGFEAGVYEVQVTDARSDREMGAKTTLTLDGENEVIDRRSMVFDDKPKEKKEDKAAKAEASKEQELTPDDDAYWAGGPKRAEEKQAPLPPPAHLQEKPGCGCRVGGTGEAAPAWGFVALGLCLLARRAPKRRLASTSR
jgi:MYXO-CTERM domain-containing protein